MDKEFFVAGVDESIVVDPHVFVEPEVQERSQRCDVFGVGRTYTLSYLPDVS